MLLSDVSIKRPVFAAVMSLLLVAFGLVAFERLPLREYPDIDPPVVSISTYYPGAAANVVESRITEVIEERIAGVEGVKYVSSVSEDWRSRITIEFELGRDIDAAANDIRDRISGLADDLPREADAPEIRKADADDSPIFWMSLTGENLSAAELTDYAERYLVDRFSVIDGVSRVIISGDQTYAMRVWIDRKELAARNLTVADVENALRAENVELPAGNIEGAARQFTVRTKRTFSTPEEFAGLVLKRGEDGSSDYLVRLGDVARVEKGVVEDRTFFRGEGIPRVGIGIVKQSTANTLDVVREVKAVRERLLESIPPRMRLTQAYDSSVFVENAINEVYKTLFIAIALVVLVIFLFLGNYRAMLVPAVTVPVSLIATALALLAFGFSVNLLTLLALILSIGLVVDDSIVVLENISRRMDQYNEPPLLAAFRGTRQVGFAVIATTVVLVAVFVPIAFQQGDIGRLFAEFALTMSSAVLFSSFVALSLSPMLASKLLIKNGNRGRLTARINTTFNALRNSYRNSLAHALRHPLYVAGIFVLLLGAVVLLFRALPQEYAPKEDRGVFFVFVTGPEGATFRYTKKYLLEIERRLMPYVKSGEFTQLMVRAPGGFGSTANFNSGFAIVVLNEWSKRRGGTEIMSEVYRKLADIPGVTAFPLMRQGFGSFNAKPVEFVLAGGSYEDLARWRDILIDQINRNNPGLISMDWDYKETKPQLQVKIDYNRAADLGVKVSDIGHTLETMLGSRRVTTYIDEGEEYDVIVEGEREQQRSVDSLQNIYVRSERSGELIPLANLVNVTHLAAPNSLNRYNRTRAITLQADLADHYTLGEALAYLEKLARENLPWDAQIDYKGQSQDFKSAGSSLAFIFLLGLFVTYLALAAQFENWVHPMIIMLSVPLAMVGGLAGLYFTGASLNLYSQIGLIMLVGLAAKNGILIVEFANQLRDQGKEFIEALLEAAEWRLRPILMTSVTTAAGSVPLILSFGAGAETRSVIGTVVLTGVLSATVFTLYVIPVAYMLMARHTRTPHYVSQLLADQNNSYRETSSHDPMH